MKKTVWLLDADMTLFDFEKAERFALREACARFGIEISVKESALYHDINEALWRKLERGETTQAALQIERFETFADALGLSTDPHALAEAFVVQLGEGCFLFEQALSLLQNLHARCRVAIVTNGITQVQKRRLAALGSASLRRRAGRLPGGGRLQARPAHRGAGAGAVGLRGPRAGRPRRRLPDLGHGGRAQRARGRNLVQPQGTAAARGRVAHRRGDPAAARSDAIRIEEERRWTERERPITFNPRKTG